MRKTAYKPRYVKKTSPAKGTRSKAGSLCIAALCLVILAGAAFGGYELWHSKQVKFHDVTVELGTGTVSIRDFMTQYARPSQVGFVSDVSVIDLNSVGKTELILRHGKQEQTVTLTVQDTTEPTVEFLQTLSWWADEQPEPEDFIANVSDHSETSIRFEQPFTVSEGYADQTVRVVVEDAWGNGTVGECTVVWNWLAESCLLELGDSLTAEDLLANPGRDSDLLDQAELDRISSAGIGTYTLTCDTGAKSMTCTVTVQDTVGPVITLREAQCDPGGSVTVEDFVESAEDFSGVAAIRFVSAPDCQTKGTYTVEIEAEDTLGNITRQESTLWVTTDRYGPVISGASGELTVERDSTPDFLEGVTATDDVSGDCRVSVDTSGVNLSKAGTYFITYSAVDAAGNETTLKRKVTVTHNAQDTAELVAKMAERVDDDPVNIRYFVRNTIHYSSNWGGDDPAWFGFTYRHGNCYVHAVALQAILEQKGYETQLIWVTDKSHYWVIVKVDGVWWHLDATPSDLYDYRGLMDDATRYATLANRNWDRTKWPVCGEK